MTNMPFIEQSSTWQQMALIGARFSAAAGSYDQVARLQRSTAEQLFIINQPHLSGRILDLGCGTGINTQRLCGVAKQVVACDIAHSMLKKARVNTHQAGVYVQADAQQLPFAPASFDAIYSNLMVQWLDDLIPTLTQLRALLTPQGHLCIATLTKGTLTELANAWRGIDQQPHINDFIAVNTLQEVFTHCGFKVQIHTATQVLPYQTVSELAKELKQLGANHVKKRGKTGLMGRYKWQRMVAQYEAYRDINGFLPATYQVAYITASVNSESKLT